MFRHSVELKNAGIPLQKSKFYLWLYDFFSPYFMTFLWLFYDSCLWFFITFYALNFFNPIILRYFFTLTKCLHSTNLVILTSTNFWWVFEVFRPNSLIVVGITMCLHSVQTLKLVQKDPINLKFSIFDYMFLPTKAYMLITSRFHWT